jgi:dTDP-4-amino-4,6-dideoxygalactose transaminase
MDAIQAALLRLRLPGLDAAAARRRANASFYAEALVAAGAASVPPSRCGGGDRAFDQGDLLGLPVQCSTDHTFNQFVVRVPDRVGRDALRATLTERGIGTEIYYPLGLHQQECFASLGHRAGEFPVAEAAAQGTLALPIFPELTADEREFVVEALVDALR